MFIWPTTTKRITSHFRPAHRKDHHGIDIAEPGRHEVFAVADGTVSRSYFSSSYGECIMIVHNINGQAWESVYAHLREGSRRVKEGQKVKQGQVIGIMGNTGRSTGQHLHFELHKGRWNANKTNAVDPLKYLDASSSAAKKGNETIKFIQSTLNSRYGFKIKVDGIVGHETKKALIKGVQAELNQQFNKKLKIDGILGPKTKDALVSVRPGSRGNLTWLLQAALLIKGYNPGPIDGINGTKTQAALKQFQKDNKLAVDGIAGEKTWTKLLS